MNFKECVEECLKNQGLVNEFNRLYGCKLGIDNRSLLDKIIDSATGNQLAIEEKETGEIRQFVEFVKEYVWIPLAAKMMAEMMAEVEGCIDG